MRWGVTESNRRPADKKNVLALIEHEPELAGVSEFKHLRSPSSCPMTPVYGGTLETR
jgi:hypothetical protein